VTADEWIAEIEALGGRCERKPAALAFHWRGMEMPILPRFATKSSRNGWISTSEWARLARLRWRHRVARRRPDKSDVVRTLVAEAGPGVVFAYLGDDLTDEPAFRRCRSRARRYWCGRNSGRPPPRSGYDHRRNCSSSSRAGTVTPEKACERVRQNTLIRSGVDTFSLGIQYWLLRFPVVNVALLATLARLAVY